MARDVESALCRLQLEDSIVREVTSDKIWVICAELLDGGRHSKPLAEHRHHYEWPNTAVVDVGVVLLCGGGLIRKSARFDYLIGFDPFDTN